MKLSSHCDIINFILIMGLNQQNTSAMVVHLEYWITLAYWILSQIKIESLDNVFIITAQAFKLTLKRQTNNYELV